MKKRVIIGLSGGVDSSVAAALLVEQGYDVEALFMRNWHDTTGLIQSDCHWEDDLMFAEMVAKKLKIPFHFVDLSDDYRKRVVDYMFSEYEAGRTPNPDILCNREIKFDSFAAEAVKLGGDYVATGHYCRKEEIKVNGKKVSRLLAGVDGNKDQSYFLCQVSQEQLAYALFPVGGLNKPDVRKIAEKYGLVTAQRKDSQGICFVGKVHLPTFLQQKLAAREGSIIELFQNDKYVTSVSGLPNNEISDNELDALTTPHPFSGMRGREIGNHNGAHFFTIGQRKGINIGGRKEPLFVIGTDIEKNIIYVGEGQDHPGLHRKGLFIGTKDIHYIREDMKMKAGEHRDYEVRIRYRQPLQKGRIFMRDKGLYIIFNRQQRGVAPGQFAAWYENDEVIGSGVINH